MKQIIYKRFIFYFFISFSVALLSIMTFNYFVDPGNQFSHGKLIEQKMVDALLADKKVIVEANYNERLLQKMMIDAEPQWIDWK